MGKKTGIQENTEKKFNKAKAAFMTFIAKEMEQVHEEDTEI